MRNIFKLLAVAILLALLAPSGQTQPSKQDPEKVLADALKNIKLKDKIDLRTQAAMDLADFGPKAEAALADLLDCLQTKNEDLRLNAAIALGKIGKAAVPAVAKLLADNDIDTRYYAVFTIAAIGPDAKETLPAMIKLASDKNEGIRRKAVYALGRLAGGKATADVTIGDIFTIEVLVKAVQDKDDDVRQTAGDALAKFGKPAVPYLRALLKEKNAGIRLQAATSLGDIGGDAKDAVPALQERFLAKDSESPSHYANVLAKFGKAALPALEAGFKDERAEVRQAAALALQQLGGDSVGILIDSLGHKNVEVRRQAALTLWPMRIGDKSVVIALGYALTDADGTVRYNTMHALQALGAQAKLAGPKLKEALTDVNPYIGTQAWYLLYQIGEDPRPTVKKALMSKDEKLRIRTACFVISISADVDGAIPILVAALKHDDFGVKMQAASTLAQPQVHIDKLHPGLSSDKLLPIFTTALKDKTPAVRTQGVQGLNMLQNRLPLAPKIAEMLRDPDANVRQQAINTLQNGRGAAAEAVVPVLTAIYKDGGADAKSTVLQVAWLYGGKAKDLIFGGLKEKDAGVRQQAIYAVQNLQGDLTEALPALAALMKDKDAGVNRQQIVWVMSRGGAAAAPHLADLLKDKDGDLRTAAMQALRNMGQNAAKALPAIKEAVKDENTNVRLNAMVFLVTVGGEGPEFLVKHFKAEPDANVRVGLLQNLAYSGQSKLILPFLKNAMTDPSAHVRLSTVNILGYVGNTKEGLEAFTIGLKDKDANVRSQAAFHAGTYGDKAWDPLTDALKSTKDSNFRQAVLQGMLRSKFTAKTAVAPLTDCLGDADNVVRQMACNVLSNIGPAAADALPALRQLTNDPNPAVQNDARAAIQQIGPRKK